MANEADIRAIVQTIEPLFKKLHNTLYEIILVDIEKNKPSMCSLNGDALATPRFRDK